MGWCNFSTSYPRCCFVLLSSIRLPKVVFKVPSLMSAITATSFVATITAEKPFRFEGTIRPETRVGIRITHLCLQRDQHEQNSASSSPVSVLVKTLCAPSRKVDAFCIAAFAPRRKTPAAATTAASSSSSSSLLMAEDIVAGLNVQVDVDDFTELLVVGPGSVVAFGEQITEQIDEEEEDDDVMGDDEDDDIGDDDDSDGEFDPNVVLRLARD